MAAWDRDDQHVEHRRWTLTMPAHHTDVASAVTMACRDREQIAPEGSRVSDVEVIAEDELLVVFYTLRLKPPFAPANTSPKEFLVQETNDAWKP